MNTVKTLIRSFSVFVLKNSQNINAFRYDAFFDFN